MIGTTNYLYDGDNSVEELDQTGAESAYFVESLLIDEPLAEVHAGSAAFYEQDAVASVTSLTGATGTVMDGIPMTNEL